MRSSSVTRQEFGTKLVIKPSAAAKSDLFFIAFNQKQVQVENTPRIIRVGYNGK